MRLCFLIPHLSHPKARDLLLPTLMSGQLDVFPHHSQGSVHMNPFKQALLSNATALRAGFEQATRIAMHEANQRCSGRKPQEPDIVAMLVLEGVPYIANTLRAITAWAGIRTTVSSVFCHQRPEVLFNRRGHAPDRCELGDILLVHRHSNARGRLMESNALLLQAKLCGGAAHPIPAQERHQLRLYQHWPSFEYSRSGPRLNGQTRNVTPKRRHSGAQYLLIDDGALGPAAGGLLGLPGTHCMAVWPAEPVLYPSISLAEELLRFLLGLTGRSFQEHVPANANNWDAVVWDLLEHSLGFVFNRKNAGIRRQPRAGGDPLASSLSLMNFCVVGDDVGVADSDGQRQALLSRIGNVLEQGGREPPNRGKLLEQDMEEAGGVSVVLVETRDGEDTRERPQ